MTFPIDFRSYPFTSPLNYFLDRHDRRDRRGIGLVPLPGQDQLGVLVTDPIGNGTADFHCTQTRGLIIMNRVGTPMAQLSATDASSQPRPA